MLFFLSHKIRVGRITLKRQFLRPYIIYFNVVNLTSNDYWRMPVFAASYHVWRDFLWTRYSALILREATSTSPAWLQINSYIYESPHNCPDFDLKSGQILITFQNESVRNFFGFWTFTSHTTAECCAMLYWFLWRLDLLVISKSNWISLHTTASVIFALADILKYPPERMMTV